MKILLTIIVFFPIIVFSQSTKKPVIYDVVHLKNGKVLFGEIIEFAQKDGDLTFKDQYNRIYSLSREMYDYFEEDKAFQKRVKNIDSLVRPRKIDEFDFHIGLSMLMAGFDQGFIADANYVQSYSNGMYFELPTCLSLGAGKYVHRQHYLGIGIDLTALGWPNEITQFSANYRFQYDAMKNNVARYIPISFGLQKMTSLEYFDIPDMSMPPFPSTIQKQFETNISSLNMGIGHGFSFIGKDLHYFNLEIMIYKGLWSNYTFISNELFLPKLNYKTAGAQLQLSYHF